MTSSTLRVVGLRQRAAERPGRHSHAERGNECPDFPARASRLTSSTLRVVRSRQRAAERPGRHSHAERGNECPDFPSRVSRFGGRQPDPAEARGDGSLDVESLATGIAGDQPLGASAHQQLEVFEYDRTDQRCRPFWLDDGTKGSMTTEKLNSVYPASTSRANTDFRATHGGPPH